MGTRADFYIGGPDTLRWLGSIAFDGYPIGLPSELIRAATELAYTDAVLALLNRDDATTPEQGWPWPWPDSRTTDYAYTFTGGAVHGCAFGLGWWLAIDEPASVEGLPQQAFPDMTAVQNIAWGARSGLIVLEGSDHDDDPDQP